MYLMGSFTIYTQVVKRLFSRHSTMLVGQTGSGKSVCWKILQASMTRMKRDGDSSYNIVKVS